MLSNNPTDIDAQSTGLDHWVRRATDRGSSRSECHYTYQGVQLVVHPKRAAMVRFEDRVIWVGLDKSYTGRGWFDRFLSDIETAIEDIKSGGGEQTDPPFGDKIRQEIKDRADGTAGDPSEWWQFLDDDELPILLGCWMHKVGVMSMKYEISRNAKLDFQPTNDEFDLGARVTSPDILWATFNRLARARKKLAEVA